MVNSCLEDLEGRKIEEDVEVGSTGYWDPHSVSILPWSIGEIVRVVCMFTSLMRCQGLGQKDRNGEKRVRGAGNRR